MKDIAIFGVGGFGREVLTLIKHINQSKPTYRIIGFFDDGHEQGEMVNGYPVLGTTEEKVPPAFRKDLSQGEGRSERRHAGGRPLYGDGPHG